jgi:hypothetical protein
VGSVVGLGSAAGVLDKSATGGDERVAGDGAIVGAGVTAAIGATFAGGTGRSSHQPAAALIPTTTMSANAEPIREPGRRDDFPGTAA